MTRTITIAALMAALSAAPAAAQDWRTGAAPGTRAYRYTSTERAPGRPDQSYRVDFDLVSGPDHGVTAVVRRAAESEGGEVWTEVTVDAACATAMHAGPGEMARVALWPMTDAAAHDLGETFLAGCAPRAIFFPMTDILNVTLVQSAPQFELANVRAPDDRRRTPVYAARLDRLGVDISMSAEGGETRLVSLDARTAVVDWTSDPMTLNLIERGAYNGQDLPLEGVEHYAFRLEFDVATGALRRARTTVDRLDMVVILPGLPVEQRPKVVITREVAIEPTE